jgi:Reverse transcriptase (RNA-dependent DNA polymerase)
VALHGLEERIQQAIPGRSAPAVSRYADDLVVVHPDREVIEHSRALIAEQLHGMGWELKPSKTRITHTLQVEAGRAGFDFLGFVRHEVAYTAVMPEPTGHNLVFCHQYPTKTCGWSNPAV